MKVKMHRHPNVMVFTIGPKAPAETQVKYEETPKVEKIRRKVRKTVQHRT